ncbi:MAG: alpha/beta hydrolase [Desulfovibrio sp.]|jgi:acetyl esterase/lipase|nr:alpha/beta hydrolase [Desulfovibrio sp.]
MATLHKNLQQWLEKLNAENSVATSQGYVPTVIAIREGFAGVGRSLITKIPDVALIREGIIPTPGYNVPVRVFHPAPEKELPVLMYYHGGGHCVGSVSMYDPVCRKLALASNHIVVAPEYRLAPETPYPAGQDDCVASAKHVWTVLDGLGMRYKRVLSVSGDSAGGALAAIVAARSQWDPNLSVHKQVLIYPNTDYTLSSSSFVELEKGYWLEKGLMEWFSGTYLANNEDRKAVSPLYWEVSKLMPPAIFIIGQFDPLREEGLAYAEKLKKAEVPAEVAFFDDMMHPFLCLEDLVPEACAKAYAAMAAFLQK